MADYACEDCHREAYCDYAYDTTNCEARELLELTTALPKEDLVKVQELHDLLALRREQSDLLDTALSMIRMHILDAYPDEDEIKRIKSILEED